MTRDVIHVWLQVGMMFMLYGASYALLNPVWGWAADRVSSSLVILAGAVLLGAGCLLVGPVPGLGLQPSYPLTVTAIIIAGTVIQSYNHTSITLYLYTIVIYTPGFGLGAQLVAAFSEAQRAVLARGFPDNLTTYALVSSIWTSTFALGAFVGPTAAGSLYDLVGFRWSMLFPVGWNVVVGLAAAAIMLSRSGGGGKIFESH